MQMFPLHWFHIYSEFCVLTAYDGSELMDLSLKWNFELQKYKHKKYKTEYTTLNICHIFCILYHIHSRLCVHVSFDVCRFNYDM